MIECDIRACLEAEAREGEETAEIYRREARALYESQPGRAAVALIDAAYANDRDEAHSESIARDLKAAVMLAPNTEWIASAARRLFVKIGRWQEALELLAGEFNMATAPDVKIACALEAASIQWIVLNNIGEARAWVSCALQVDSSHIGALYDAFWLDCAARKQLDAARNAEKIARILGDPEERAVLLVHAANAYMAMNDDHAAAAHYQTAVQTDRKSLFAALGMALLNEKNGKLAEAAQSYAAAAALFDGNCCAGEFYSLAGTLYYCAGDFARACAAFDEAQKKLPDDTEMLSHALETNRRIGNVSKAMELEQRLIGLSSCERAKAERLAEMARIALSAGNENAAAAQLEKAEKLGERSLFVFDWQCALFEKNHACAEKARLIADRLRDETCASLREYYVWALACTCENAGMADEARTVMKDNLHRRCFWRYCCNLEKAGDDEDHVRMLDAWLKLTKDRRLQNALRSRIVSLLTERLGHPEIAEKYVHSIELTGDSHDIMFRRMCLQAALGMDEQLLESLQWFAIHAEDDDDKKMWMLETAEMARKLGNISVALQCLRQCHDLAPMDVPAVEMFHAIALAEGNFPQVMIANEWRAGIFAEHKTDFFAENAWAAQCLNDTVKALEWFKKALDAGRLSDAMLREYVRLLRQAGQFSDAAAVLTQTLAQNTQKLADAGNSTKPVLTIDATDTDENEIIDENDFTGSILQIFDRRDAETDESELPETEDCKTANETNETTDRDEIDIHFMTQVIYDLQAYCMGRPAGLVEARKRIFFAEPTFRHYVLYVIELLISGERNGLLDAVMEATAKVELKDEETRNLVLWLKAELLIALAPDSTEHVDMMLRACLRQSYGMELRVDILRQLRNSSDNDVTEWLEKYAAATADKWISAELLREASMRSLWVEHNFDAVRRTSLAAFRQSGNDWRTLWELERFADISEDYQALGVLREKMAQLEVDPKARLMALKCALAPYMDDELSDHAMRVAQECLKLDAHDFTALLTSAQIAEEEENYTRLAGIADRLAEASHSPENRLGYGLWAARLWYKLDRGDQAFASLSSLLAHDPASAPAIAMSEKMLSVMGQWDKLSLVYVRAINALPLGERQIELLRKHSELLANQLDDAAGASMALSKILAQAPDDIDALVMQTKLLSLQKRWSEAVETLELRIKCTETAEDKRTAEIELGDILIHQIGDMNRARRMLRRHLSQFEHDIDALRLLYDIACTEHEWLEARVILDEICSQDSPILNWAILAYTRIAREAEWANDVRVVYERRAISAVIGHRSDFETLVADYLKHGDLERLIKVASYDLSKAQDPETVSLYRGCVAALYVANNQHRDALAFLSGVINDGSQTDWAYLARAQALFSAGQLDSSAAEFRRTLTMNLAMDKAYEPFLEVLRQLGDNIALEAARTFVDHRLGKKLPSARVIQGNPRGFFDIELIPIERAFLEAFQYLRLMTPYIYPIYERAMQLHALDSRHWAVTRCRQLFGQNFEVRPLYVSRLAGNMGACVRLTDPPALVMSQELVVDAVSPEFDFWAAYAMHQAVSGGAVMDAIDNDEASALFMALCQPEPETARAQALKKLISKRLPRGDRKLFKDGVPFQAPDWTEFRNALSTRAACIAAIISGSPACALTAFPNNEDVQKFIISDTFIRLTKLYFS